MASLLDDQDFTDRLGAAIVAGLLGGVAMAFALSIGATLLGLQPLDPLRFTAVTLLGETALLPSSGAMPVWIGAVVHLVTSAVLGGIFGVFTLTRDRPRLMVDGILYALGVWAFMQYIFLPSGVNLALIARLPADLYALSHAIFGFCLIVLLPIERRLKAVRGAETESDARVGVERIEIRGVRRITGAGQSRPLR